MSKTWIHIFVEIFFSLPDYDFEFLIFKTQYPISENRYKKPKSPFFLKGICLICDFLFPIFQISNNADSSFFSSDLLATKFSNFRNTIPNFQKSISETAKSNFS